MIFPPSEELNGEYPNLVFKLLFMVLPLNGCKSSTLYLFILQIYYLEENGFSFSILSPHNMLDLKIKGSNS